MEACNQTWTQWSECSDETQTRQRARSACPDITETKACFPKYNATFTLPIGPSGPMIGFGGPKFSLPKTQSEALALNYVQISDCSDDPNE